MPPRDGYHITTSPHAELQIACAPPYCRALSAPTNNIRIGRRTAICSVQVRLGQQSRLTMASSRRQTRSRVAPKLVTPRAHFTLAFTPRRRSQHVRTDDGRRTMVRYFARYREKEIHRSTKPSFPPCGDREISVGDLSFLSFLSRSSAVKIAISVAFLS